MQASPTAAQPGSEYERAVLAHARHYSGLIRRLGPQLHGGEQLLSLTLLNAEQENLAFAQRELLRRLGPDTQEDAEPVLLLEPILLYLQRQLWMQASYPELFTRYDDVRAALQRAPQLAGSLLLTLLGRGLGLICLGRMAEARLELQEARRLAELRSAVEPGGRAAHLLGFLESRQSNFALAEEYDTAALTAARAGGNRDAEALILNSLGNTASEQGRYAEAEALHLAGLKLRRSLGDRMGIAASLNNLGNVYLNRGDYDSAVPLFAEALECFRGSGNRSGVATVLNNLGYLHLVGGRLAEAEQVLRQAQQQSRETGDPQSLANCSTTLGYAQYRLGNYAAARSNYRDVIQSRLSTGDRHGLCVILTACAALLAQQGDYAAAARCSFAARYHAAQLGYQLDQLEQSVLDECLRLLAAKECPLTPAELAALEAEAQSLSLEALARLALTAMIH